ncbi:MAG: TIGR03960 family B12-binding radical SAM protein [Peptococcaceae bacterium]|nr:TIGR03960 family B12-binding radical SAM protein [Peptococcaceae bacterium]
MRDLLDGILQRVQKPARYVGGEWNAVIKDWSKTPLRVAFCFPDVYEVGMSYPGLQILYQLANSREDVLWERVFAPWPDMEDELRKAGLPLFSLESRHCLREFDIVAFTLQYELTATNILNMLDLGRIPLWAGERQGRDPLVVAGGPCAFNPEPLAPFFDAVVLGEGEEVVGEILTACKDAGDRDARLALMARIPGVYLPSNFDVSYREDGRVAAVSPRDLASPKVTRRVVTDLDSQPPPVRPVVPSTGVVHDRATLEVFRGCTHGCRFCQAGIIYRPVRERSLPVLLQAAGEVLKNTGQDEIALVSLSTTDYSGIRPLLRGILDRWGRTGVHVSLPSLRVDAFAVDLAREARGVRGSSLTFAPEAGTQRLRDVINKGVTEEDLLTAVGAAFASGWHAVKLYFMIGLPTESREDLAGIVDLVRKVVEAGRAAKVPPGRLKVTASVSSFVPKAHTPFQWEGQDSRAALLEKQAYLREHLRMPHAAFSWHDPQASFLEAVLARGDRRLAPVIQQAWAKGCRFDGWSEWFKPDRWDEAFRAAGLSAAWYAHQRYDYGDVLPWDHLESGVDRAFLVEEHRRACAGLVTPDCRTGECAACGLCPALEVEPVIAGTGE